MNYMIKEEGLLRLIKKTIEVNIKDRRNRKSILNFWKQFFQKVCIDFTQDQEIFIDIISTETVSAEAKEPLTPTLNLAIFSPFYDTEK